MASIRDAAALREGASLRCSADMSDWSPDVRPMLGQGSLGPLGHVSFYGSEEGLKGQGGPDRGSEGSPEKLGETSSRDASPQELAAAGEEMGASEEGCGELLDAPPEDWECPICHDLFGALSQHCSTALNTGTSYTSTACTTTL